MPSPQTSSKHWLMQDLGSLPIYVRLLVTFPTAAVLAFLLAQSAGWFPSLLKEHLSAAEAHTAVVAGIAKNVQEVQAQHAAMLERMTTGLRVMCENAARDLASRNNCQNIK